MVVVVGGRGDPGIGAPQGDRGGGGGMLVSGGGGMLVSGGGGMLVSGNCPSSGPKLKRFCHSCDGDEVSMALSELKLLLLYCSPPAIDVGVVEVRNGGPRLTACCI